MQDIEELVYRLFWAIDARQWEAVAGLCTPDASADWDGLAPGPSFAAAVRARLAGITTHHQCTNALVSRDGASAQMRFLVAARHRRPMLRGADGLVVLSDDTAGLRRLDGRWAVRSLARTTRMVQGNPGVLAPGGAPQGPAPTDPLPWPPQGTAEDHRAIHDLMMRFGRALDARDWAGYRACFAAQVTVDFAQTTGHAQQLVRSDDFVAYARLRQRGHAAFHQYSNFQASVAGDRARCILYMAAHHHAPGAAGDPMNVFVGWYDNELVRTDDGWRISRLRHPLQWVDGNAAIKDAPDPEAEALGRALFGHREAC